LRGEVISVDNFSGDGLVVTEDSTRYSFAASSTRAALRVGDRVDFVADNGVATDIIALTSRGPALDATGYGYAVHENSRGYNFGTAMFSFKGRLRRSHYWISWAILFFGYYVLSLIPIINIVLILTLPGLLWANLAVGAKRFHDMGRSGWLIAIPWSIMIVGIIASIVYFIAIAASAPSFDDADAAALGRALGEASFYMALIFPVPIGFWLWLGIADSQPGRNKYGPNPKNPVDDTANTFA